MLFSKKFHLKSMIRLKELFYFCMKIINKMQTKTRLCSFEQCLSFQGALFNQLADFLATTNRYRNIAIIRMTDQTIKMDQPTSSRSEPWTDFPKLAYSFINDDFVHDKRGVLKVNLQDTRGGISIKQTIVEGKSGHSLSDETKFWLALPGGRSFYGKFKTGQNLKIHLDNGTEKYNGRQYNLYGTLNFSRQLGHLSWRIGAAHKGQQLHTDNRLRIDNNNGELGVNWYNRTLFHHGKWSYGLLASYDLNKNLISKNSLLLGYKVDDWTAIYLRAENEKFRTNPIRWGEFRHYFDHFYLDGILRYDEKTKLGFELVLQSRDKAFKEAVVVVERRVKDDLTVKMKLSSNIELNLLCRTSLPLFEHTGKISFGLHGSNLHRSSRVFKFGSQLEFNL